MGTGSFPGVKSGRGVTLTPHLLLVPWSRKDRAISLVPLWSVRPVQSLSACTRVHFTYLLLVNVVINFWTQYTNELGIPSMRFTLLKGNPERLRGCRGNSIKHTALHSYCDVRWQQTSRSRHTTKKNSTTDVNSVYWLSYLVKMWNLRNSTGGYENGFPLLVAAARLTRWCRIGNWTS